MKVLFVGVVVLGSVFSGALVFAQDVITKNGYTLSFENNYAGLDTAVKQRLIKTFFEVYPRLVAEYNPATLKSVKFAIDTAYKGVAATDNGRVVFSAAWMKQHPEDIDVVTHEVMHIVQNYGRTTGPGWLTEGIADYARNKFGVDNATARWALAPPKEGQSYTNSYRVTARFLDWLETKDYPGIVKQLDAQMRAHTFTGQSWKELTGKTVDELWALYTKVGE